MKRSRRTVSMNAATACDLSSRRHAWGFSILSGVGWCGCYVCRRWLFLRGDSGTSATPAPAATKPSTVCR